MNAKQFRTQYLLSLGLTVLAVVIFIAAIIMFLVSSGSELTRNLENAMNNPDLMVQIIWNMIIYLLINSVYAMLAIGIYWIGVIWNIIVAASSKKSKYPKRSQPHYHCGSRLGSLCTVADCGLNSFLGSSNMGLVPRQQGNQPCSHHILTYSVAGSPFSLRRPVKGWRFQ